MQQRHLQVLPKRNSTARATPRAALTCTREGGVGLGAPNRSKNPGSGGYDRAGEAVVETKQDFGGKLEHELDVKER